MSLISFTQISDGSTAAATQVNTPLSTIYNDYNGNITDANIASGAAIAQTKIALKLAGALTANVATSESTTSATFTDLATPGPAVTVTIGSSGMALVIVSADLVNNTASDYAAMGFAVSGASTVAAASGNALYNRNASNLQASYAILVTGLTAGSNTFTAKYERVVGGTATFANRVITVIPL